MKRLSLIFVPLLTASMLLSGILACSITGMTAGSQDQSATETLRALSTKVAATLSPLEPTKPTATEPPQAPQPSPSPTPTPTVTATPTPSAPSVRVSVDTNCRFGPGEVYDYEGALLVGEEAEVIAKNRSATFWYIRNPDAPPEFCWIWGYYASVEGDTDPLPVYTPPPTPTPAPGSISGYVWIDADHDGKREPSEYSGYLTGARIHLKVGACPGGSVLEISESVHPDGRYRFGSVPPGDYCVQRDMLQQTLFPDEYDVTLAPGQDVSDLNFGYRP